MPITIFIGETKMVIIGFRLKNSEREFFNTAKSSFNKRGDNWIVEHTQMFLPTYLGIIDRQGLTPLIYRGHTGRRPDDINHEWLYITLPVSERHILEKRSQLNLHQRISWTEYKRLWRDGYCEKSLLKTAMTCSNIIAYLLGYPDYYTVDPDDLFERLQQYR